MTAATARQFDTQVATMLETIGEGVVAFDREWRYIYVNRAAAELVGKRREDLLGKVLWAEFPMSMGTPFYAAYQRAMTEHVVVDIEAFSPLLGRWFEAHAYPAHDGLSVIMRDITARKQAETMSEVVPDRPPAVQAAIARHDAFLASIAHDLRSPLTVIQGTTQLLRRQAAQAEQVEHDRLMLALNNIASAATQMAALLDDLLDMARLHSGRVLKLKRESMDLVALVQRCAAVARQSGGSRTIQVVSDAEVLIGLWDAGRLERAVGNLLANSVKYSPDGSQIQVTVRKDEQDNRPRAVVTVADHGLGIPRSELAQVFDWFYRAGNVIDNAAGSGIGLATVREIVEQHGGSIRVSSTEGSGSTFTILLPLAPLPVL